LKTLSVSSDLQQLGIEGDDGFHHDVATKDNVDGQDPNHYVLPLAATHVTPSSLFSSVEKQVCKCTCFEFGLYPIHP